MLSDIGISQKANMKDIREVAKSLNITEDDLELYGKYKAKLSDKYIKSVEKNKEGKLVLVTAINPTPAGEGKTTTTIGIGQAMGIIGKSSVIVLREPSLGPVFGMKGGAAGGGYSQVVPMEDINLHFTGDFHAITSANNLLAAAIDNHIKQGNSLGIEKDRILVKRALDMNDRALRKVEVALGGKINGEPRNDEFVITVASEVMAILCLSSDIHNLKERLGNIIAAYNAEGKALYAKDLKVNGAMAALLKDAMKPNLVQTLENTPCIIHGGPFANIAHGCNSVVATKLGLRLADYCITEAGFGADLGAEKFLDIKCRVSGLSPDVIVIVATIKALKYNGGVDKDNLKDPDLVALNKGIVNLEKHIENMKKYGVPVVVALNKFQTDTDEEIEVVRKLCDKYEVRFAESDVFMKGGEGGIELSKMIVSAAEDSKDFKLLYDAKLSIEDKIETITKEIYGAGNVIYSSSAKEEIKEIERLGKSDLPICIAKTQYSLSDDPKLLGRPEGFDFNVKKISLSNGAGFIVVLAGDIMTMPGLPKTPAFENIDIDKDGNIVGIF